MVNDQIIKTLIKIRDAYKMAIEEMPEKEWLYYLRSNHLQWGICFYVRHQHNFHYEIMAALLKESGIDKEKFICKAPRQCNTYTQALIVLQVRLNFLEEKLKEFQK